MRNLVRIFGLGLVAFCASVVSAAAYDASAILDAWEDVCLKNAADPERLATAAEEGKWPSALEKIQGAINRGDGEVLGMWLYRITPEPILLWSIRSNSDGVLQNQCEVSGEIDDPENLRTLVETKFDMKLRKVHGSSMADHIYYHPLQYDGRDLSLTLIWSKSISGRLVKLDALYRADSK